MSSTEVTADAETSALGGPLAYYELTDVHPAADLLPMLPPDELAALAESGRDGWHVPVVVGGHTLVDGRNRLVASMINGIDVATEELNGRDPQALVIKLNLERRHLNPGQKAMFFTAMATLRQMSTANTDGLLRIAGCDCCGGVWRMGDSYTILPGGHGTVVMALCATCASPLARSV